MTDIGMLRPDPAPALVATFAAAAARMDGLAFVNPHLRVEAVHFAAWGGHWLGVLVTPWFMNLVLAPREPSAWTPMPLGGKRHFTFPAGDYEFIGARDPACGEFAMCSLFSPVLEFADHAQAIAVATHALAALFDPRNASDASSPPPTTGAASSGSGATTLGARLGEPLSRRELLRGRFLAREA